jgi:ATP:ADP antiporter, AAA family
VVKRVLYIFAPIHKGEWKKFLSMGAMLFFILFNYTVLRAVKDSLIVPIIGAEAIPFVKMYVITPAALSFMLLYTYLSERLDFEKIFYYIAGFFLVFFLAFAFILYPLNDWLHPKPESIQALINTKINFGLFILDFDHFKWFFKIYGKWIFVLYYIVAELWGSAMIFMLYWQFANNITKTEEAKRIYPMCGVIGHIGAGLGGIVVQYAASQGAQELYIFGWKFNQFIMTIMLSASFATLGALSFFIYIKNCVIGEEHITLSPRKQETLKSKITLAESLKIIISTRYLWLIVILIFSYGININIIEGVWKSKLKILYPDVNQFAYFMGDIMKWTAVCTIVFMITGAHILRILGWLFGAMLTPTMMLITGIGFFAFVVFDDYFYPIVSSFGMNPIFIAVVLGAIQNILTKGIKYSFFDTTKEMAYIPASADIKSKGKAAIDVVGARWAKSGGALIQSLLFIIFPSATYDSIAPYLMIVFILLIVVWFVDIKALYVAYTRKLAEHNH